jgi:hypothetical protein
MRNHLLTFQVAAIQVVIMILSWSKINLSKFFQVFKGAKFRVFMRCVTWSRDSHGLFDYESRYINKKNIKTNQPGKVVRLENDVEFVPSELPVDLVYPEAKPLL